MPLRSLMKCLLLAAVIMFVSLGRSFRLSGSLGLLQSRSPRSLKLAHKAQMSTKGAPKVLVPVAQGSEEIETVTIVDVLVRGGAKVTLAAVNSTTLQVSCSRGVNLVADAFMADCAGENWDMIVCPGGAKGAEHLRDCRVLHGLLVKQHAEQKYLAAICAAPATVLVEGGIVNDRKLTCYPAERFTKQVGQLLTMDEPVVVDGHVITSQGPGTAMIFALKLVEVLFGQQKSNEVRDQMVAGYS